MLRSQDVVTEKCPPTGPPLTCWWLQKLLEVTDRLLERSHRGKNDGKTAQRLHQLLPILHCLKQVIWPYLVLLGKKYNSPTWKILIRIATKYFEQKIHSTRPSIKAQHKSHLISSLSVFLLGHGISSSALLVLCQMSPCCRVCLACSAISHHMPTAPHTLTHCANQIWLQDLGSVAWRGKITQSTTPALVQEALKTGTALVIPVSHGINCYKWHAFNNCYKIEWKLHKKFFFIHKIDCSICLLGCFKEKT